MAQKPVRNACLGISNKKDLITQMINDNKIDILCLQEVELDQNVPNHMMSFKYEIFVSKR